MLGNSLTIRCLICLLLWSSSAWAQDHGGHHAEDDPHEVEPFERDFPEGYEKAVTAPAVVKGIRKYAPDTRGKPQKNFDVQPIHDDAAFVFIRADRLENRWRPGSNIFLWDTDASYGTHYDKLYLETEGEVAYADGLETADLELLYSRAVTPFWDLQAGLRHEFLPDVADRNFAALGFQGAAPLRFEVDATLYVDTDGNLSAAGEFEYDFILTQRLRLQPRVETSFTIQSLPEYNIGSGMNGFEAGLRLGYQVWREFAPYVGVSYEASLFETKSFLEEEGETTSHTFLVAGLKLIL